MAESRNVKLLVVEDHPHMQTFMAAFCELNGYAVDIAGDGTQGLNLIMDDMPYNAIIVDFLMPGMHGVEFVKQARERWADVPIIAMSGFDDVGQSFLEAGARTFLPKPFDPYQLEREIEQIVGDGAADL
jgi:DNA-binding response OmpR family regulator